MNLNQTSCLLLETSNTTPQPSTRGESPSTGISYLQAQKNPPETRQKLEGYKLMDRMIPDHMESSLFISCFKCPLVLLPIDTSSTERT